MANKWVAEYHEDFGDLLDGGGKPWWEVRNTAFAPNDYYIVEDVGDPKDGERLAAMLNERVELIDFRQNVRKVLGEVLGILPELPDDFSDVELPVVDLLHIRGLLETWIDK